MYMYTCMYMLLRVLSSVFDSFTINCMYNTCKYGVIYIEDKWKVGEQDEEINALSNIFCFPLHNCNYSNYVCMYVCNRTIRSPRLRRHIILLHFIVYGYICTYIHT